MLLQGFYQQSSHHVQFSREQGSKFAKAIADDYNPLHDVDAKRFCIPGDLLFSWAVQHFGLRNEMAFRFEGMVDEQVRLVLPSVDAGELALEDEVGKRYLSMHFSQPTASNQQAIDALIKAYVAFSGHTFPHILVPLMAQKNVMITPSRPMVMYQSMALHLKHTEFTELSLVPQQHSIECDGKRGNVVLRFNLQQGDSIVGHGEKVMLLSGLKPFDQAEMDALVAFYQTRKGAAQG